jgi:predicted transcriptional regulator
MAIITVRIPDELKATMDNLDEINWSAVTRNLLEEKVEEYYIRDKLAKSERQIKEGKTLSHGEVKKLFMKK